MSLRRTPRRRDAQLAFDALSIEGGLLSPDWLARVAQLSTGQQSESDYRIPKGLNIRDEIGRYWRMAQANWREFAEGLPRLEAPPRGISGADARALAERFVLPLLRECFGFASLVPVASIDVGDRAYPIGFAALSGRVPVVIAAAGSGLDAPSATFADEGRKRSAFGIAQEFLNAEEQATWGLVCDGVILRIVRDNASLTRPAWIEADLRRIFTEERYSDFAALWLLAHETRFGRAATDGSAQPATACALDAWREAGREEGVRAREHLRRGVEEALLALGQGFLSHGDNSALRTALQDGSLTKEVYFQQLLRLVYRLIFLITVEERGLLHPSDASEGARQLYADGYSLRRLRDRAARRSAHDRFADLWEAAKIVFRGLAAGEPRLGLPALAGIFASAQCPALDTAKLENRALLLAVFRLAWLREKSGLARVNWRDMGPEELGSVYEGLLELVPQVTQEGRGFAFATGDETKGNARKTSGSYYTPDSLVQVLLDSALEPVVQRTIAAHAERPADALLELSIVDPACGSGHFLLAAARRVAAHFARVQSNGTPSAAEYRRALRRVVGRCVYGVDQNPMAVELCKVSLWMEAVEPGLPLTFLDSHIQCGNALLGATPELMASGVPDAAWEPIEGDDRKIASALKKRNKVAAAGQRGLSSLWSEPPQEEAAQVAQAVAKLEAAPDVDATALARKEQQWGEILGSDAYRHQKFVADAWCAAFVWPKQPGPLAEAAPTNELWRQIRDRLGQPPVLTVQTTVDLASQYRFFHWHLAFPQVFAGGGFDVVLGNPPWDELTPSAKEFFSVYESTIRFQDKSGEQRVTAHLLTDSSIAFTWEKHCRELYGQVHYLKKSGRYVLFAAGNLGKGDFNVYRMFVETAMSIARAGGMVAQIVPETFYGGATTMAIRRSLLEHFDWNTLLGFENAREGWFKGVDSRAKFCLYAARKGNVTRAVRVRFNIKSPSQLAATVDSDFIALSPAMIRSFSPETLAIMELSSPTDVLIATKMHAAWPALGDPQSGVPGCRHMRELDMTSDSMLFSTDNAGLPLYEGRMVGLFDHRAKGYRSGKARAAEWVEYAFGDSAKAISPQWYVDPSKLPGKLGDRPYRYRVGFCNIASPTNERTLVAALIPPGCVCGNKVPTLTFDIGYEWYCAFWVGLANSFVMDFVVRKKVSLTMTNTIVDSLPFPKLPTNDVRVKQVVRLVAELCCVGPEMQGYWDALARAGWVLARDVERDGIDDSNRRALIEAELNVIVARDLFHLKRDELGVVLDTFPIVAKRDRKAFGEFRTKRLILEAFDRPNETGERT